MILTRLLTIAAAVCVCSWAMSDEPRLLGRTSTEWAADLRSEDELVRTKAAWALAQLGVAALDELSGATTHTDSSVRTWALRGIGQAIADEANTDARRNASLAMLERGLVDESATVRLAAAEALIDYGDPRGLEAVATLLEDRSDQVRHHALLALDKPMQLDKALILKVEPLRADPYEYTKRVAERIVRRQQKASK